MVKRGEVWLVDFEKLAGRPIQKKRPALIIQNDLGNRYGSTVIVAAIQADPRKPLPVFAKLPAGTAGLAKDSVVNCSVISTLPIAGLESRIGELPESHMQQVDRALKVSLGMR